MEANQSFSHYCFHQQTLFPFSCKLAGFDELVVQSSDVVQLYRGKISQKIAISIGNAITIGSIVESNRDILGNIVTEIEFDSKVVAATWDNEDQCLAVAEASGVIHLVEESGKILFTKKISPSSSVVKLEFYNDVNSTQQLICILSDQKIVIINEMDIKGFCVTGNENARSAVCMTDLMKRVKFQQLMLPLPNNQTIDPKLALVKEALTLLQIDDATNMLQSVVLIESGGLPVESMKIESIMSQHTFKSFEMINHYLFALTTGGKLVIYDMIRQEILTSCYIAENIQVILGLVVIDPQGTYLIQFAGTDDMMYMATIIIDPSQQQKAAIIIPHGQELNVDKADYTVAKGSIGTSNQMMVWLQQLKKDESELQLCTNSYLSKVIAKKISAAYWNNTTDQSMLTGGTIKFTTFPEAVGTVLRCNNSFTNTSGEMNHENLDVMIKNLAQEVIKFRYEQEIVSMFALLWDKVLPMIPAVRQAESFQMMLMIVINKLKAIQLNKTESGASSATNNDQSLNIANHWRHLALTIQQGGIKIMSNSTFLTVFNQLCTGQLMQCIKNLLSSAQLEILLYLLDRQILVKLDKTWYEVITTVPSSSTTVDVKSLIILLEKFTLCDTDSTMARQTISNLMTRALMIANGPETATSCIQDAVHLLEFGEKLIHVKLSAVYYPLLQDLAVKLKANKEVITLQVLTKEIFGFHYTYDEIMEIGKEGILFERLDHIHEENELQECIANHLKAFCHRCRLSLDELLLKWITEAMENSVLMNTNLNTSSAAGTGREEEEESTLSAQKIMIFVNAMTDPIYIGKGLLKLLQIPDIETILDEDNSTATSSSSSFVVGVIEKVKLTCEQLLLLGTSGNNGTASSNNGGVNKLREELMEAIRHFTMKVIALKYHVKAFDIRNKQHLMSIISIIVQRRKLSYATWLQDLAYVAVDQEILRVDVQPVLVRLLSNPTQSAEDIQFEELKTMTKLFPLHIMKQVLEDVVRICIQDIDDIANVQEQDQESRAVAVLDRLCLYLEFYIDHNKVFEPLHSAYYHGLYHVYSARELHQIVKRMKLLVVDFKTIVSVMQMKDEMYKRKMVKMQVQQIVKIQSLRLTDGELDTKRLWSIQKMCTLLQLSPQYGIHELIKTLLAAGLKSDALEIANWNMKEISLNQSVAISQDTFADINNNNTASSSIAENSYLGDWNYIVEQASSLNIAALQHNKVTSTSSYGYLEDELEGSSAANDTANKTFDLDAFNLSKGLLDDAILSCDNDVLCGALDISTICDSVIRVYQRFESTVVSASTSNTNAGAASTTAQGAGNSNPLLTSDQDLTFVDSAVFSHDGLLMQRDTVIPLLSGYAFQEIKMRSSALSSSSSTSNKKGQNSSKEVEKLIEYLQSKENNLMALDILLHSWSCSLGKSQLLRSSLTVMCRKLLLYRNIDISLTVAYLCCLPLDHVVKELKAAVPSIQSDYSRLHTVALIGEEVSHLWEEENLLILFQGLQSNAKWWYKLATIGITAIDMKMFSNSDMKAREKYLESLIPLILSHSHMNLELTLDYCRSFDLLPEMAAIKFVEVMLMDSKMMLTMDYEKWTNLLKKSAQGMDEHRLLNIFASCYEKMHPLAYERITFVSTWITSILPSYLDHYRQEEEEDMNSESDSMRGTDSGGNDHDNLTVSTSESLLHFCQQMKSIIEFLSTIHFPKDTIDQVKILPSLSSYYHHNRNSTVSPSTVLTASLSVSSSSSDLLLMQLRIPLWSLRTNPWLVLDPIFRTASKELLEQLSPICYLLNIDKEDFNARSIFVMYASSYTHHQNITDRMTSFQKIVDDRIVLLSTRVVVWKWIFELEQSKNRFAAIQALENALAVIEKMEGQTTNLPTTMMQNRQDFQKALKKYHAEEYLERIVQNSSTSTDNDKEAADRLYQTLLPLIDHQPLQLLSLLLEFIIERCWLLHTQVLQMISVDSTCLPYHTMKMMMLQQGGDSGSSPLSQQEVTFLATYVENLHLLCASLSSSADGSNGNVAALTMLDTCLNEMISRLLIESNSQDNSNNSKNSSSAALTTSTNTNTTNAAGQDGKAVSSAQSTTAVTGGIVSMDKIMFRNEEENHPSSLTSARRIDIFMGFGLHILLCLQGNEEKRYSLVQQLDAIMRASSTKSMRRLTTRSRLRAAFAVISMKNQQQSKEQKTQMIKSDCERYGTALYLLAELHEIRLSCSDAVLLSALGLQLQQTDQVTMEAVSEYTAESTRALIVTWLYDEGIQRDAVELARDLYILSANRDSKLLERLLVHMIEHGLWRSLLMTLQASQQQGSADGVLTSQLLHTIMMNDVDNKYSNVLLQIYEATVNKVSEVIAKSASGSTFSGVYLPGIFITTDRLSLLGDYLQSR